jgi:hypothetical protein
MKTAPYFAFYASDTMADKRYRSMRLDERGLLLSMMCECWVNHSLPDDAKTLGKWLGFTKDEVLLALTENVAEFFTLSKGEYICPEIEKYREKILERRRKKSEGGRKGAKGKWNKSADNDGIPNRLPSGSSMGCWNEKTGNERTGTDPLQKDDISIDEAWVNDYEKASKGE